MRSILFLLSLIFISNTAFADVNGDVQRWLNLRQTSSSAGFQTYANFINAHPDWPENRAFLYKAEDALLGTGGNGDLVRWFDKHPPLTDAGKYRYVQALEAVGNRARAQIVLRDAWRDGAFNEKLQAQIWSRYSGWLNQDDYEERLQKLLWDGNFDRAATNIGMVKEKKYHEIAKARIALQRGNSKAIAIVDSISRAAKEDNGVLLDLARYYRQHNMDARAMATMAKRHDEVAPYETPWWKERNLLVRRYLEKGEFKTAYNLAKNHGAYQGSELAEAEWLSGWLAVTRLRQPQEAFKHFQRMYKNVKTPISIARAAYWAGIACEQMKDKANANAWYKIAAQHMNTFYGQLAGYALGNPKGYFRAYFAKSRSVNSISATQAGDLVSAARILHRMGKEKETIQFLRAGLKAATDKGSPQAIIPVALELDNPSVALQAAKAVLLIKIRLRRNKIERMNSQ